MEELGGPAVTSTADEARRSSGPASRNGCSPDRAGDRQLRCGTQKPRFGRGPPLHERQHRLRAGAAAARGSPGWVSWLRWATATAQAPACRGFPSSTKPRASTWRKTRWCGDRAQAGHGWPALACWSQGRRSQAMRTIPALPRLPPRSLWTPALFKLTGSGIPQLGDDKKTRPGDCRALWSCSLASDQFWTFSSVRRFSSLLQPGMVCGVETSGRLSP